MGKKASKEGKIRESIVDGIFYPSESKELGSLLEKLINGTKKVKGDAFAIITPHAGYSYAGDLLASAFVSAMDRNIENIIIIAPVHNYSSSGIYLPESKFFLTPLGSILVNQELVQELLSCSTKILSMDIPHLEEHCIELQLPFIRYIFPNASIVPVLLGDPSIQNIKILSNALQLTFSPIYNKTLFVITANMTAHINKEEADKETLLLLDNIREKKWQEIANLKKNNNISSCGAGCISTILSFNLDYKIKVLKQGSSGVQGLNKKKVVNYAAISLYRE